MYDEKRKLTIEEELLDWDINLSELIEFLQGNNKNPMEVDDKVFTLCISMERIGFRHGLVSRRKKKNKK